MASPPSLVPDEDRAQLLTVLRRGMRLDESEPFLLSSGALSPVVFDVADAICDDALPFVVDYLLSHIPVEFDAIGGPALGAGPIVHGVNAVSGKRSFQVRPEPKSHGARGRFKGRFVPGDRILVFEDVASSGYSLLRAMEVIASAGGIVVAAATLIDRGDETGVQIRRVFGVPYYPLTTYEDFGIEPVVAAPAPSDASSAEEPAAVGLGPMTPARSEGSV